MLLYTRDNLPRFIFHAIVRYLVLGVVVVVADLWQDQSSLQTNVFDVAILGVLAAALSIFLAFRVSEAYERWWEARKLWGRLVNASRDFSRQVASVLPSYAGPEERAKLVRRQIAYTYALRRHLLPGAHIEVAELAAQLDPAELKRVSSKSNVPSAILRAQACALRSLIPTDTSGNIIYALLDRTLTELYAIQGGCERIRNTVFPARVTFLTRIFVAGLVLLMPVVVLEQGGDHSLLEMGVLTFVGFMFVTTEEMGSELKKPFDGRANVIPMGALCRTIEIDLLEALEADDIPPPADAVKGVLF